MRKNMGRNVGCLIMAALMAVSATGCGDRENPEDFSVTEAFGGTADAVNNGMGTGSAQKDAGEGMEGDVRDSGNSTEEADSGAEVPEEDAVATAVVADFGLRLLQICMENAENPFPPNASMPQDVYTEIEAGKNVLISPLSVISALAMTGGGAKEETLKQMEEVFGTSVPELSAYLSRYQETLPDGETCKLSMANGIWFTDDQRFTVEPDFLQACADSFGAAAHRAPFDQSTLLEINGWVKDNTDGMIEEILDEIPSDAVMYLVNALAFDGEWERIYTDYEVREGEFTKEDGTVQQAEMMYSEESQYLEDEHAAGFLKYYAEGKYAFAALLPEEGMSVAEYVATLDGAKLRDILSNPAQLQVNAAIPKYESEYSAELSDMLQEMGMTDAFDMSRADFSGLGSSSNGNIYISRVLHKTFIAVDERGTRAGAATAVEVRDEGAMMEEFVRTVYLNRPFLYMIVDCEENLPVFLGVVAGVEEP